LGGEEAKGFLASEGSALRYGADTLRRDLETGGL
jgi:hypothetical protein